MDTMKKALINALFFVATIIVNTLGAIGLINGLSQKEISDMYQTLITPSPFTFSIWGVIYSFLLISIILIIVKKNDLYYQKIVDTITPLFRISCVLNFAWIVTFSYVQIELSVIFIFAFLIALALLSIKLLKTQQKKRFLIPITFGLYTGWLFIATVVNIAAELVKLQWDGFGINKEVWATIILIVAVVLVVLVLFKLKNAVFPLPIAWAYFGIYQFLINPEGFAGVYYLLQTTALTGSILLVLVAIFQFYRNKFVVIPLI